MHPTKKKRFMDGSEDCRKGSSSMSEKQRNVMLEFLSENPSMIRDRSVGGTSNRPNRDELWEKLAAILNSCGSGAQKDGGGWRRSWQDLKRYESLKAKESMTRLGKLSELQESPTISLSPLQEKIATLLNISIKGVAECVDSTDSNATQDTLTDPNQCTTTEIKNKQQQQQQIKPELTPGSTQGDNLTEVNIAQALNSIAAALTQRNTLEERKLRVFENLLTVYAAKNGIAMTEAHNLD